MSLPLLGGLPSSSHQIAEILLEDDEVVEIEKSGHLLIFRSRVERKVASFMTKFPDGELIIIANSWGGGNADHLSRWYVNSYNKLCRIVVLIEAVSRFGFPLRSSAMAEVKKNYYIQKRHWPCGIRMDAFENIPLDDDARYLEFKGEGKLAHVAAEWAALPWVLEDVRNLYGGN